jgi:hypothetical protein
VFTAPLSQGRAAPSLRSAAGILLMTFLVMLACLLTSGVSQTYPALFLIALFPSLFWTFRYGLRGARPSSCCCS